MNARDLRPGGGQSAPAGGPADRAHTFAVVVGIDIYPGYGDLSGACNDAKAFYDWVTDPSGADVPEENARLHISGRARSLRRARPLKREIDRDLDDFVAVARTSAAATRHYLFFSGHGIAPAGSTAAGVLANATRRRCWNLSFSTYLTWFERCKDFSELVMLSDCCRTRVDAAAGAPLHDICGPGSRPGQLTLVAHAADVDERAFEDDDPAGVVRGFFTSALLDGLRGEAADPALGVVDTTSLAAFLRKEVGPRSGNRQYPDIRRTDLPLPLAQFPPVGPPTFPVPVRVGDGPMRKIRVLDNDRNEVASFETAGGETTLTLPKGWYKVIDPNGSSELIEVEGDT